MNFFILSKFDKYDKVQVLAKLKKKKSVRGVQSHLKFFENGWAVFGVMIVASGNKEWL